MPSDLQPDFLDRGWLGHLRDAHEDQNRRPNVFRAGWPGRDDSVQVRLVYEQPVRITLHCVVVSSVLRADESADTAMTPVRSASFSVTSGSGR